MNQQQLAFIQRALKQLNQVIDTCGKNSCAASETLGRKKVGRHIVAVKLIAEIDEGFSAPLASHTMNSQTGNSPANSVLTNSASASSAQATEPQAGKLGAEPDYSTQTEHHNTNRGSRWHKPIF